VKHWKKRQKLTPGARNVVYDPLVDAVKVFLPPLHIKLGLVKKIIKAVKKDGPVFLYLQQKFPRLSEAKIKEGIFVGPQIREITKDKTFDSVLNEVELAAWTAFKDVGSNILGNNKVDNYQEIVERLLQSYEAMGCNMSLKNNNNIDVSCCIELNVSNCAVYTQQRFSSFRYTSMMTCFGSLSIHLQVTYHIVDYVV
jgi:hypothetical protein